MTNSPEKRNGVVSAATTTVAEAGRYAVTNNLNIGNSGSFVDMVTDVCVTISHIRMPVVVVQVATASGQGCI